MRAPARACLWGKPTSLGSVDVEPHLEARAGDLDVALGRGDALALAGGADAVALLEVDGDDEEIALDFRLDVDHVGALLSLGVAVTLTVSTL